MLGRKVWADSLLLFNWESGNRDEVEESIMVRRQVPTFMILQLNLQFERKLMRKIH